MSDKVQTINKGGIFTKTERASELYTPTVTSAEADICLNCPLKRCNPNDCKRYKEERKKLRSVKK